MRRQSEFEISVSFGQAKQVSSLEASANDASEFLFGEDRDDDAIREAYQRFSKPSLMDGGFSWQTALSATVLSHLAYRTRQQVRTRLLNGFQFREVEVFTPGSMQAIAAVEGDLMVVAFRGTANTWNWLINLNTFSTSSPIYGTLHGGFYHAFQAARPEIEAFLDRHATRHSQLVLAGHSLGGALATVAAAEWHRKYGLLSAYTIGQPAVGKRDFHDYAHEHFAEVFFRMVNEDDVVPMVPPGYKHVGNLLHFGAEENVTEAESVDGDMYSPESFERFQNQLRQTLDGGSANESFGEEGLPNTSDHGTDKYLRKILNRL